MKAAAFERNSLATVAGTVDRLTGEDEFVLADGTTLIFAHED